MVDFRAQDSSALPSHATVAAVVPLPMPVFVSGSGSLHPVRTEAASVQAHSAVAKIAVRVTSSPELRVVWWSAEADRPVP